MLLAQSLSVSILLAGAAAATLSGELQQSGTTSSSSSSPGGPITASRVRSLTREAQSRAKNDPNELILALDKRVREIWGDFESFPISIVRREAITVTLTTPFMGYRRALAEYLRMRRPVGEVPWIDAVVISVTVNRVDAPDFLDIIVERNGKPVAPVNPVNSVKNPFKPMTFSDGNNRQALLHAGELWFPVSAFAPGATVTVSAVPASGDRVVFTLESSQLQDLK